MGDVASLAVGLHLNAANFKSQLMSAYGSAESQSRQFNRNARADAKKTEDAYKRVSASVSGLAGRLAGFAGAGLSLGTIISTTRQYSQSLSDLQAITGATSAQMKLYDQAAQEMGRTTEYSASQAAEAIKLMASAKPELLSTSAGLITSMSNCGVKSKRRMPQVSDESTCRSRKAPENSLKPPALTEPARPIFRRRCC